MLSLESWLRPRSEELVAKVLDGEALIINMATGVYYSMPGSGAFIWECLAAGCRLKDLAAAVARCYQIDSSRAETDVLEFAATLSAEALVEIAESPSPAAMKLDAGALAPGHYATPAVEIYRDIGHLVALDPPMPGLKDLPWKGSTDETNS